MRILTYRYPGVSYPCGAPKKFYCNLRVFFRQAVDVGSMVFCLAVWREVALTGGTGTAPARSDGEAAEWTPAAIQVAARAAATNVAENVSCNCLAAKVLVLPADARYRPRGGPGGAGAGFHTWEQPGGRGANLEVDTYGHRRMSPSPQTPTAADNHGYGVGRGGRLISTWIEGEGRGMVATSVGVIFHWVFGLVPRRLIGCITLNLSFPIAFRHHSGWLAQSIEIAKMAKSSQEPPPEHQ